MKLITLEQARTHVNADSGDESDDALLTTYCNGAEAACARLANRNLYATATELQAAVSGVPAMMEAAYVAYDAAVAVAESQTDARMKAFHMAAAQTALNTATNNADAIINGLALDVAAVNGQPVGDDIILAVLMTVGHSYRNRESVVAGQGAAAVEVPLSAQAIMRNNRWIGAL